MSSTFGRIGRSRAGVPPQHRVQVFFDADCGFCSRAAAILRRLDRRRRLELVPLQVASNATIDAPPADVLLGAMHVRDHAGRWSAGGAAWVRLAEEVPLLRPFAVLARAPGLCRLVEPTYALVAANRHRLGRVLGERACSADRPGPSAIVAVWLARLGRE